MFRQISRVVVFLALGIVAQTLSASAAPAPPDSRSHTSAQRAARPGMSSFIWTNDEVDMLRQENVPISIVGQEPGAEPATAAAAPEETEQYDRTKDPEWYAEQAAMLQAELADRQNELDQQLQSVEKATNDRQTDPGVALDRGNAGITPESGIENLRAGVRDVQDQLDALADLARQNDIPPGVFRG